MKKFLCILLTAAMLFSLSVQALALSSVDYTFNITSNGANEITVETGSVITVVYTISSTAGTDNPSHVIASQNEIYYDSSFFQLVNRSATVANGFEESEHTKLNGSHMIYYNTSNSKYYNVNGTEIGTFKLKVIAASGSSAIQSTSVSVRTDGNEACNVEVKDLVVKIKGSDSISVSNIALNTNAVSLKLNESVQMSTIFTPSNATNKNVTWSSNNSAVAEVDLDGKITAKSEGTAVITAKSADGGKTAACTVTVTAQEAETPADDTETDTPTENTDTEAVDTDTETTDTEDTGTDEAPVGSASFVDVKKGAYYYNAVLWAADKGITGGVDATHFNPNGTTTRAQMVTFLWRAAGCPEPESGSCAFTDVKANAYYYKAVLWAAEQGITTGVTETTFVPDKTVTRAQAVTYLWRYAKGGSAKSDNPFADVASGAYYYDAVLWAKAEGVTGGVDAAHFAPNKGCTRGQIVTFLYRSVQ